jgi:hypothetical protein
LAKRTRSIALHLGKFKKSTYMPINRIFIFSILFLNTLFGNPKDNTTFISPVKIPLLLSANFGELRIDHYHSGLDIKTQGVTGKEVVASADGYVYRISVSPGGFGKALYLRHPSGYSSVYGHLERFTPEIEEYVKSQQYEKKSFLVTLFPAKEKFTFNQGDLIAYSGNSGSSGGPHLHYEIRKSDSEIPVNPLTFDFGATDNISPVIEKLIIYPINRYTTINNIHNSKKLNVTGEHGRYSIAFDNQIVISGLAGFGIKSFDLLNDSFNKCAVYSIELEIDSILVFKYVMDQFSFNESRYINSHIDYEEYMKENIYYERTFILPNDKLSVYKDVVNRGIFNFRDDQTHHIKITVADAHSNKSTLSFKIKSQPPKLSLTGPASDKNQEIMPYNRSNKFETDDISVNIPSGALYDTLYFEYKKDTGTNGMLSDLHFVHNIFTPLHKAYTLSIKPKVVPKGKQSKMIIVQLSDDNKRNALNCNWTEGFLTAEALAFGKFYIGIDTIPPSISSNGLVPGADLTGKAQIKIRITDDLSGIKSYEPSIDGNWALFEYDQKNNLLIYKFDNQRLAKGKKHSLTLKVTDNKNNTSFYTCDFTW